MHLSEREVWGLMHGLILGALFLLAFAGSWRSCGASGPTCSPPRKRRNVFAAWQLGPA